MPQTISPETEQSIESLLHRNAELEQSNQRLRESLRSAENLNTAFFQYNPTAFIVVDRDCRITGFSKARAESGTRLPEIGRIMYVDYAANHEFDMVAELQDVIRLGEVRSFVEQKYDEQYLDITLSPFPDGAVIACRDVTKRKTTELENERIQAQLVQSQKMEAVGRLAGGVAHDFNNLLTAIQGYLELALIKVEPGGDLYQDLDEVLQAANRAADLTRQLLLFSRQHLSTFKPIDPDKTINNLLKMLHRLIGEDIGITTLFKGGPKAIRADQGALEQVIVNLAVNARDAMPRGGQMSIQSEKVMLCEAEAKLIPDARPGVFVRLTVSDSGSGIPKDILPNIFEPFFTTKKQGKGTGLGLSVVYGIIKQHNGWIHVRSTPGQGTLFDIYLPFIHEKADIISKKTTIDLGTLQGGGEHILVIEDEKLVRDFASRALRKNGYVVTVVPDGAGALNVFDREKGEFDMVFCDVVLPDISGVELVEHLLTQRNDLKVLVTSGYTDTKSQWSAIRQRGYAFLQKPYVLEELLVSIHQSMHGQSEE